MFIHKLNTNTAGGRFSMGRSKYRKIAQNHKRVSGSGLKSEIYENGKIHKKSDLMRNLKISQPRMLKKYISFE